jgi:hypothetical protein
MNKRISTVLVGVAVLSLSSTAFASRAREAVMGNGDPFGILTGGGTNSGHGTFYYEDNYNIFYNPSYANDFKNWATIEKDNGSTTQAEGGFVASMMNFSIGAFYGRNDANFSGSGATALNAGNPIDLIIAGDMGVKWGLGLSYAQTKTATDVKDSALNLHAGVQVMDFEPFIQIQLTGNHQTAANTTDKDKSMSAGVKYHWGEWTPYAAVSQTKVTPNGATDSNKNTVWGLGIGRTAKMGDTTSMHYSLGYWHSGANSDTRIPVDLAFESEFTSWLIGRAGLTATVFSRQNSVTNTIAPTGRVGATLRFNKVDVDFAVGGGSAAGDIDAPAFDFANGLFSVASLTYRW